MSRKLLWSLFAFISLGYDALAENNTQSLLGPVDRSNTRIELKYKSKKNTLIAAVLALKHPQEWLDATGEVLSQEGNIDWSFQKAIDPNNPPLFQFNIFIGVGGKPKECWTNSVLSGTIRPGSVTYGVNALQSFVEITDATAAVSKAGNSATLTSSGKFGPPGTAIGTALVLKWTITEGAHTITVNGPPVTSLLNGTWKDNEVPISSTDMDFNKATITLQAIYTVPDYLEATDDAKANKVPDTNPHFNF